jgi:transposase
MRFVALKSEEQLDMQTLPRIRDRLVVERTLLMNQIRSLLLERAPSTGQTTCSARENSKATFREYSVASDTEQMTAATDETSTLSPRMRLLLTDLANRLDALDDRIEAFNKEFAAQAREDEQVRRLMGIPGIDALNATALLEAVGDGRQFRKARDLAAWLGLVPRQHSTGGKTTLLGISKRGNPYLRRLIVHGARSCIAHLNRERDKMGEWIGKLEQRMHINKVVVAFANKIARMMWAVLTRPGNLYERVDPAHA